jgi:hypothetical protein
MHWKWPRCLRLDVAGWVFFVYLKIQQAGCGNLKWQSVSFRKVSIIEKANNYGLIIFSNIV